MLIPPNHRLRGRSADSASKRQDYVTAAVRHDDIPATNTLKPPLKGNFMTLLAPPCPPPYPPRYIIDPVAFFAALILGPLMFTGLSFWIFFIPIAALIFGGPVYLLIGTPLLLWYLRRHDGDPVDLSYLAFKVVAFAMMLGFVLATMTANNDVQGLTLFFTGFGIFFGPAWAYSFGKVYQRLRRDFFAKPRTF